MARNLNGVNLVKKVVNQNLTAYYYPPKTKLEFDELMKDNGIKDFRNLKPSQIKAIYSKNK